MNILQANKAYYPHLGGVETVVQQLAEGFAVRPGVSSAVIACADAPRTTHETINGVKVVRTATFARPASFAISPSYAYHLLRHPADILQMHEPSLIPSACYLAMLPRSRRCFKRLVVWWHSEIVRQKIMRPLYRPLLMRILTEADAIVVSSPNLISSSAILAPFEEKCRIVHLGIEPERFTETAEMQCKIAVIHRRYHGKQIVLFTGRLVYYKGVEYLLRAMRDIPDAQLVIVGRGKLRPKVDSLVAQCPGNVDVIDYLAAEDLAAMYMACSIFVLPSVEKTEALGIVQLEAMANAKPVITSDLETGVTYVNQHGRTGIVVPRRDSDALRDAIRLLLDSPEMRSRLGLYAQERVQREFTVAGMVSATVSLYEELLAGTSGARSESR
jgi:glycosyltransferase involved in cell wall biosynthesis